jgi:flagellar basal-body rod protein FlgC
MRMNVVSANLANVNTTRSENGMPYRRKVVLMEAKPVEDFDLALNSQDDELYGVKVSDVLEDTTPFRRVFEPGHPHADDMGYVSFPNVDVVTEMANMMIAKRSYEANVSAISTIKRMALKALELGR